MKKSVFLGLFLLVFFSISTWTPLWAQKNSLKNSRVLVYTKNGVGYVHDNIPSAVACIQDLGLANKFLVDVSDDPTVFAEANLVHPTNDWMQSGGKKGIHTEHLGYLLAEMQFLQRAYPGLEW